MIQLSEQLFLSLTDLSAQAVSSLLFTLGCQGTNKPLTILLFHLEQLFYYFLLWVMVLNWMDLPGRRFLWLL